MKDHHHYAVREFYQDIEDKNYKDAAHRYYNWAYMFQSEFNQILDDNGVREIVFKIMDGGSDFMHVDQI